MSWKTPLTLLVLLGVLIGAAYYGWQSVISPPPDTSSGQKGSAGDRPTCDRKREFRKGRKIQSEDIVVNVYNAGATTGLADATLDSLRSKGFRAGVAENAPAGIGATNVTILTGDRRLPQVQLVADQFKGRVAYAKGVPLATGIDVIVGDSFAGMDESAKSYLRLRHAVSTCRPAAPAGGAA
ncbi:MAG: LytR C-terminal domain-containing protein [Propionibacteriales bacterium]|nr:LytR C-terminal domain-containing protein [Propionibacteriales bacterium]